MDRAVACTCVELLCMKINEHYYIVIRMITAAERTIEHVIARAMEIPDGCSHTYSTSHITLPHGVAPTECSGKGSCVLHLRGLTL